MTEGVGFMPANQIAAKDHPLSQPSDFHYDPFLFLCFLSHADSSPKGEPNVLTCVFHAHKFLFMEETITSRPQDFQSSLPLSN